jgi:hypothetical protein
MRLCLSFETFCLQDPRRSKRAAIAIVSSPLRTISTGTGRGTAWINIAPHAIQPAGRMYPLSLIVIGLRLCWSMKAATAT